MAIFSQNDTQTEVDFRHYNNKTPIGLFHTNYPKPLKQKLKKKLMKLLNLTTGSIDMILTKKKEYVYLEVNPVGQYDMVSVPCNYYLIRLLQIIL